MWLPLNSLKKIVGYSAILNIGLGIFAILCGLIIYANTKMVTIFEDTGHVLGNPQIISAVSQKHSDHQPVGVWVASGDLRGGRRVWRNAQGRLSAHDVQRVANHQHNSVHGDDRSRVSDRVRLLGPVLE